MTRTVQTTDCIHCEQAHLEQSYFCSEGCEHAWMQQAQDLENQRRRLNEELSELWSQSHPVTPQKSDIDRIESVIASVESQQRQMRDALSRDLKFFSDLSPKGESFNDVMKTMWDEENRPADQREKSVPELIAELQRQNQQLSARVLELERRAAKGKK